MKWTAVQWPVWDYKIWILQDTLVCDPVKILKPKRVNVVKNDRLYFVL